MCKKYLNKCNNKQRELSHNSLNTDESLLEEIHLL